MDTRNTGYKVRRAFRGVVLFLTEYSSRPLHFRWSTADEPHSFESSAAALGAADKAAREYGAECAVVDAAGNLIQPEAARPRYYVTTFCNHAHRLSDGKPIAHECYVLPPAALRLEMDDKFEEAQAVLRTAERVVSRGVRS